MGPGARGRGIHARVSDDHQKGAALMTAGLVVQLGTLAFVPADPAIVGQLLGFVAGAGLIGGGALVAASKGYSPWLGLLGILSFVGMGILLLIPTRATLLPRRRQNEDDAGTP